MAGCIGLCGFLIGVRELTKYLQQVTAPSDSISKTPIPQKQNYVQPTPPPQPPPPPQAEIGKKQPVS